MILAIHCCASYLSEPKGQSRAGGHFFLSSNKKFPGSNGAIHNIAKVIQAVMSSAAKAESGTLFIKAKQTVAIRATVTEMGHQQQPTPIQMDNSAMMGIVMNTILQNATKAMGINFHWLQDQEQQKQFCYIWQPRSTNLEDFWMKHHNTVHHRAMRPEFVPTRTNMHSHKK